MKWGALYCDLVGVLKKHFRPEKPEPDGQAVNLIKMVQDLQRQQKTLNGIRNSAAELVKMLQDDAVLSELHRLEAMAPKESAEPVASSDDVMFG